MLAVRLTLRALMEAGIVAGLAYWGYQAGGSTGVRILLAVAAPAIGFGIWGAVDFRWAGRLAEPLRLMEELVISGVATLALYAAGQPVPAAALASLTFFHEGLVYATGGRLVRPQPVKGGGRAPIERAEAAGLTVEHDRAAAIMTISCTDRINSSSRASLAAAVRECLELEPEAIRFDLRESWIDSSGVAVLLALYDECLRAGVRVEALTAPATRELFSRLGLPLRFRLETGGQMVRVIPPVRGE